MKMQTFLIFLNVQFKKDFPDLEFGFYVSRRSRYAHMGSDIALHRIPNYQQVIDKIKTLWFQKKTDDKFDFCEPYLIASVRWKYDYIIFRKNYYNDLLTAEDI